MTNDQLFGSIKAGDLGIVCEYFDAYPEQIDVRNLQATPDSQLWDEISPIHVAAKYGQLELVRDLVNRGATVYSHPFQSYPAVALAAWEKHDPIVSYFLDEIPEQANGTFGVGITCNLAGRFGWIKQVRMHLERDPLAVHDSLLPGDWQNKTAWCGGASSEPDGRNNGPASQEERDSWSRSCGKVLCGHV